MGVEIVERVQRDGVVEDKANFARQILNPNFVFVIGEKVFQRVQRQHSATGFAFPEKFGNGFQRICAKNIFGRGWRFNGRFNDDAGFKFNFRDAGFRFRRVAENIFAAVAGINRDGLFIGRRSDFFSGVEKFVERA